MDRAFNPDKRRARIGTLVTGRTFLFWLTIVGMVCYFLNQAAQAFSHRGNFDMTIIGVVAMWMSYAQFDHELRLLKILDRLQGSSHATDDSQSE